MIEFVGALMRVTAADSRGAPVALSRRARRNLREDLPLEVAAAALETIKRAIQ